MNFFSPPALHPPLYSAKGDLPRALDSFLSGADAPMGEAADDDSDDDELTHAEARLQSGMLDSGRSGGICTGWLAQMQGSTGAAASAAAESGTQMQGSAGNAQPHRDIMTSYLQILDYCKTRGYKPKGPLQVKFQVAIEAGSHPAPHGLQTCQT